MSGLGDLFGEAEGRAAREAGGARLDGDRLDAVHTTVRRAHSRRAALRTGLVAVAAVVVGGGLFYGIAHFGGTTAAGPAHPGVTPSETPSASPSPSDTAIAMPAFAGTVTVDPHLPTAQAITPEVWASAGPGWTLISYQERWDFDLNISGPEVIYMASPQGDLYELTAVEGDTVEVLAWDAGSTTAAVSVQPDGDPPFAGMLDLVSGEVTPIDGYAPYIWSLAFLDADGAPVWTGNDATSAYVSIAPDGTQSQYTIPSQDGAVELANAQPGAHDCFVAAPFDDTSVLVTCYLLPNQYGPAVMRVWPATGKVQDVFSMNVDGMDGYAPNRVGDFVVADRGDPSGDCASVFASERDGVISPVPGVGQGVMAFANQFSTMAAVGNELIWTMSSMCSSDPKPSAVVSSDPAAGTFAVLMPLPGDRPKGEEPYQSVTGVAVAH